MMVLVLSDMTKHNHVCQRACGIAMKILLVFDVNLKQELLHVVNNDLRKNKI